MKYIKLFENYESDQVKKDIEDFSIPYLAYLFDLGYELTVWYHPHLSALGNSKSCEVTIRMKTNIEFSWDDVKDYLIPYLMVLDNQYSLYYMVDFFYHTGVVFRGYYTVEDLLEDDDIEIDDIHYIRICFDI